MGPFFICIAEQSCPLPLGLGSPPNATDVTSITTTNARLIRFIAIPFIVKLIVEAYSSQHGY